MSSGVSLPWPKKGCDKKCFQRFTMKKFFLICLFLFVTLNKNKSILCKSLQVLEKSNGIKFKPNNYLEGTFIANLTRQEDGDILFARGITNCSIEACIELFNGTASFYTSNTSKPDESNEVESTMDSGYCKCKCIPYFSTYREDLGTCVGDIQECSLSSFFSGLTSAKIPMIFLPPKNQIIQQNQDTVMSGMVSESCVIMKSYFLTSKGWSELRSKTSDETPFRLLKDTEHNFLQWVGEDELRFKMQGRLLLIYLSCQKFPIQTINNITTEEDTEKNIFNPCVAFRVNGSPMLFTNHVPEVVFQAESTSDMPPLSGNLDTKEYILIGISSLLLGFIYVSTIFLYLYMKRRKTPVLQMTNNLENLITLQNTVQCSSPFSRSHSSQSFSSITEARNIQQNPQNNIEKVPTFLTDDKTIIKNNPLSKHFGIFGEYSGYNNDTKTIDLDEVNNILENPKTAEGNDLILRDEILSNNTNNVFIQDDERHPEENISVVEDIISEKKTENLQLMANGIVRKKLYFNPAYFEPHFLLSPPPAAIEFLTKIREVITIAKHKMTSKRYQPSLIMIPEESQIYDSEYIPQKISNGNQQGNREADGQITVSNQCSGCPGCSNNFQKILNSNSGKCNKCGDKRNTIERWLEDVSLHDDNKEEVNTEENIDSLIIEEKNTKTNNTNSVDRKTKPQICSAKVIGHSLKSKLSQNLIYSKENTNKSVQQISTITNLGLKCNLNSTSEFYNNPKFIISDSPESERKYPLEYIKGSKAPTIEKSIDVSFSKSDTDTYQTILKDIKQMPDMIYEALTKNYSQINLNSDRISQKPFNIPTPDYDSSFTKTNDTHSGYCTPDPYVPTPTPDYSTTEKKSQPDSPFYKRKSPQYIVVDYETDSLERETYNKNVYYNEISTFSSNSDSGSQPSPSLSSALPLEEEVEIRNTIYNKVERIRKDGVTSIKRTLDGSNKKNNNKILAPPKIKYDTPFQGSMTIEVSHAPQSDVSVDSDQFEPDTFDRKAKKTSSINNSNQSWPKNLNNSQFLINNFDNDIDFSSLEIMSSLPDLSNPNNENNKLARLSNSVRGYQMSKSNENKLQDTNDNKITFGSLREIFESKLHKRQNRPKLNGINFEDQGRLLTLEAKHSKRQRQDVFYDIKTNTRPDVVPTECVIYSVPKTTNSNKCFLNKEIAIRSDTTENKNLLNWKHSIKLNNSSQIVSEESKTDTASNFHTNMKTMTKLSDLENNIFHENINTSSNNSCLVSKRKQLNIQNIYHVAVEPPANGMQIAMTLRERSKKSKDFISAWKRFVHRAATSFTNKDDKNIILTSRENENCNINNFYMNTINSQSNYNTREAYKLKKYYSNGQKTEFDSGYMSGDSNESKINLQKIYKNYNFKPVITNELFDTYETLVGYPEEQNSNENLTICSISSKYSEPSQSNINSSDNGSRSSPFLSSESEEDGNPDDIGESGAESIETHSVLFKVIRRNQIR